MKKLFEKWGREQRLFRSARNDELKKEILSRYSLSGAPQQRGGVEGRRRMPWLSLALAGAAVVVLVIFSNLSPAVYKYTSVQNGSGGFAVPDAAMSPAAPESLLKRILPNPFPSAPITDSREYLKTDYYSTIRTRHVHELVSRLQTIVRGFGGRVDASSFSEKFGTVSFAVPADKFEAFRSEVKSLVPGKLYVEQTHTQNLLPQKQSIEEQQAQAQKNLDQLRSDRDKLTAEHNKTIASLQVQLNSVLKERAAIPSDDPRQAQLAAQESNLRVRIANENRDYQNKLASLEAQIRSAEDNVINIQKQDQTLLDNVATVNGTVSLNWISIWEMADLYLPGPLLAWLLALAALAAYFYNRRPLPIPLP